VAWAFRASARVDPDDVGPAPDEPEHPRRAATGEDRRARRLHRRGDADHLVDPECSPAKLNGAPLNGL
jgi:hypothetical protein